MSTKSGKASFMFGFLAALKRDREMKRIDAVAALDFIELADGDLTFFRSARKLGEAISCSESTAESSLARFRARGYLVLLDDAPKASSGSNGGRLANTYRMEIPEVVSPEKSGETGADVSPDKLGKSYKAKKEVSPDKLGRVSPDELGTITIEQPLEGAWARANAPIALLTNSARPSITTVAEDDLIITDAHEDRAPEAFGPPGASLTDFAEYAPELSMNERDHLMVCDDLSNCIPEGIDPEADQHATFEDDRQTASLDDLISAALEEQTTAAISAIRGDLGVSIESFGEAVLCGLVERYEDEIDFATRATHRVLKARKHEINLVWVDISAVVRGFVLAAGYSLSVAAGAVRLLRREIEDDQRRRKAEALPVKLEGDAAHG